MSRNAAVLVKGPPRLLVLDDVRWVAFPVAGRCARLVTTRNPALGADINVLVDVMSPQALALLQTGLPPLTAEIAAGLVEMTGRVPHLLREVIGPSPITPGWGPISARSRKNCEADGVGRDTADRRASLPYRHPGARSPPLSGSQPRRIPVHRRKAAGTTPSRSVQRDCWHSRRRRPPTTQIPESPRLVNMWARAVKGMADTAQYGRVDVVVVERGGRGPHGFSGLIIYRKSSGYRRPVEAHVHRYANLPVRIRGPVPGIAEHPDQAGQLNSQARFLQALADRALPERLVLLQAPGGYGPPAGICTAQQKQSPCVVADDDARGRPAAGTCGSVRIVPVVGSPLAHGAPASAVSGIRADAHTRS